MEAVQFINRCAASVLLVFSNTNAQREQAVLLPRPLRLCVRPPGRCDRLLALRVGTGEAGASHGSSHNDVEHPMQVHNGFKTQPCLRAGGSLGFSAALLVTIVFLSSMQARVRGPSGPTY